MDTQTRCYPYDLTTVGSTRRMQQGLPIIAIATIGALGSAVLGRYLIAYSRGDSSLLDWLQGRYLAGIVVMAVISAVISSVIVFLLGISFYWVWWIGGGFFCFGIAMLILGVVRTRI